MDTQVLIVGAGPVGLTLAIDLGRRGIRCTLIERKEAPELPAEDGALQRAHHGDLSAASGIVDEVRAAGLRATCRWTSTSCCR